MDEKKKMNIISILELSVIKEILFEENIITKEKFNEKLKKYVDKSSTISEEEKNEIKNFII